MANDARQSFIDRLKVLKQNQTSQHNDESQRENSSLINPLQDFIDTKENNLLDFGSRFDIESSGRFNNLRNHWQQRLDAVKQQLEIRAEESTPLERTVSHEIGQGEIFKRNLKGVLNDSEFDIRLGQYDVIILQGPEHGHLRTTQKGGIRYRADNDFTGEDSFQYQLQNIETGQLSNVVTTNFNINAASQLTHGRDKIKLSNSDNIIFTEEAQLSSADKIIGGNRTDKLVFKDTATITADELANKSGIDIIKLKGSGNDITLTGAFVDASDSDTVTIINGSNTITNLDVSTVDANHNVVLQGWAKVTLAAGGQRIISADGFNTIIVNGSGHDTLIGGTGENRIHTTSADFVAEDVFVGGSGEDTIRFSNAANIDGTELANKSGIDIIQLKGIGNDITLTGAFVDASDSDTITIVHEDNTIANLDVSTVDINHSVVLQGSAKVTLSAGGQRVTSADGFDTLIVNGSGHDTLIGGTGENTIHTTSADFVTEDVFIGGSGEDTIRFTDATNIDGAELANKSGIDIIRLTSAGNDITLTGAFVDASDSDTITIINVEHTITNLDVSTVDTNHNVVLQGWAKVTLAAGGQRITSADGFDTTIVNGSGHDTLIGGTGENSVYTTDADFVAEDVFIGGSGEDTIRFTDAANIDGAELTNKSGIDIIQLKSNGNDITLTDAFVDASDNDTITIKNAGKVIDNLDLTDLSAERSVVIAGGGKVYLANGGQTVTAKDGINTKIYTGSGGDTIYGGTGNNTFYAQLDTDFSATDTIVGGSGTDELVFVNTSTVTAAELAGTSGIETIHFSGHNNYLTLSNALVSTSDTGALTISSDSGRAVNLDIGDVNTSLYTVEIDSTATFTLAAGGQTVYAKDGVNVDIQGGSGDDTLYYSGGDSGSGSLDGNAGFDTLGSIGTSALNLSGKAGTTFQGFEKIDISAGSQTLTLTAQDVLDMSDTTDTLLVYGDSNDAVSSAGEGWVSGSTLVASDGLTYQLYTSGSATLGIYTADSMGVTLS